MLLTYLLRREGEISEVLSRFIERVQAIDLSEGMRSALPPEPDLQEENRPMKKSILFLLVVLLTACGPSEGAPKQANVPTVDELAADPSRLKELRQQCKTDRVMLGDVVQSRCRGHAQAVLRRRKDALHTHRKTPPKF